MFLGSPAASWLHQKIHKVSSSFAKRVADCPTSTCACAIWAKERMAKSSWRVSEFWQGAFAVGFVMFCPICPKVGGEWGEGPMMITFFGICEVVSGYGYCMVSSQERDDDLQFTIFFSGGSTGQLCRLRRGSALRSETRAEAQRPSRPWCGGRRFRRSLGRVSGGGGTDEILGPSLDLPATAGLRRSQEFAPWKKGNIKGI